MSKANLKGGDFSLFLMVPEIVRKCSQLVLVD